MARWDILTLARNEVGYIEQKDNLTKYGKWFGLDGLPWCAIFVSWVYHHAGYPLPAVGFKKGFASCQLGYNYFKEKGWITTDPIPGDIVLFDWNLDKRFNHTGIFQQWIDPRTFETVEGNTSIKNQSNGGSVMIRRRALKGVVFVHPEFS